MTILAEVVTDAIAQCSPDIVVNPASVSAWRRLRRTIVDRVAEWHVEQLPDEKPLRELTNEELAKSVRARLCLNCGRTGGSHDHPMPVGWLSWAIGADWAGPGTLGWACSEECVTRALTRQIAQFYSSTAAAEMSQ
jgi:hypothetical protein